VLIQRTSKQTGKVVRFPCYLSLHLQSRTMPRGKASHVFPPNVLGNYVCLPNVAVLACLSNRVKVFKFSYTISAVRSSDKIILYFIYIHMHFA